MRGPRRAGDEVPVDKGVGRCRVGLAPDASGVHHIGLHGGIGRAGTPLEDTGGNQHLLAVANRRNGLLGPVHLTDDLNDARVQAQILGRTASGHDKPVIGGAIHSVEIGVDHKIVATFFRIGLMPLEIVHGGGDDVARLLAGADHIDIVTHHQKHLIRDHDLVIFNKVTSQHQYFLFCHIACSLVRVYKRFYIGHTRTRKDKASKIPGAQG